MKVLSLPNACSGRFDQILLLLKCEAMKVLSLPMMHLGYFGLLNHHIESLSYVSVIVLSKWYVLTMVHTQYTAERYLMFKT